MGDNTQNAIDVLNSGGIVIFPTDTAFGIGCRIDDANAVQKLFEIRRRPETKASPVLVSSIAMARQWVDEITPAAKELMEKFWPGGLTIVLPSYDTRVPSLVKGGGNTLGVRMPNHQELLAVIESIGVPLLGSSANFAGGQTPFSIEELDPELVSLVDYVMDGSTHGRESSTVVDATVTPVRVLREGAVKL